MVLANKDNANLLPNLAAYILQLNLQKLKAIFLERFEFKNNEQAQVNDAERAKKEFDEMIATAQMMSTKIQGAHDIAQRTETNLEQFRERMRMQL